jgi:hypothetical protein
MVIAKVTMTSLFYLLPLSSSLSIGFFKIDSYQIHDIVRQGYSPIPLWYSNESFCYLSVYNVQIL